MRVVPNSGTSLRNAISRGSPEERQYYAYIHDLLKETSCIIIKNAEFGSTIDSATSEKAADDRIVDWMFGKDMQSHYQILHKDALPGWTLLTVASHQIINQRLLLPYLLLSNGQSCARPIASTTNTKIAITSFPCYVVVPTFLNLDRRQLDGVTSCRFHSHIRL